MEEKKISQVLALRNIDKLFSNRKVLVQGFFFSLRGEQKVWVMERGVFVPFLATGTRGMYSHAADEREG